LALVSVVAILTTVSLILLIQQLANATDADAVILNSETSDLAETAFEKANEIVLPTLDYGCNGFGRHGMSFRRHGFGSFGHIQVSEEFEQNIINIAKSDTDVQNLLTEGYNVTAVKPIIKTIIDAEGNVVNKATDAILLLENDPNGRAFVIVDIEDAKVTEIVISPITVIEKP